MDRFVQVSITIGALGIVITLIGLFPAIAGLETTEEVGVLQVLVILAGFSLLFVAAYAFAKQTFFTGMPSTLAQDIGVRLTMTGMLIAGAAGMADVLGFGSHGPTEDTRPLLGEWQAVAFIGGFLIASSGVMIYTLFGPSQDQPEQNNASDDTTENDSEKR
ncbi:MAG: hypothetical protein JW966_00315 [Anaerolineae bacterium]|nr:hypothetical protein [Anaerolineae bacterium]